MLKITIILIYFQIASCFKPIFIVPGLGGSVLLDTTTNERVWPPSSDIFLKKTPFYEKMDYNANLKTLELGDIKGIDVENSFTRLIMGGSYLKSIINHYESNVYALPYDFRKIAAENVLNEWCSKVKIYIEMISKNSNNKISIIAHSFGGILIHYYLTKYVNQSWKDSYVDKLTLINVPFGGCNNIVEMYFKNRLNIKIPFSKAIDLNFIKMYDAILWCLPYEPFGEKVNDIIYKNREIIYTKNNFIEAEEFKIFKKYFIEQIQNKLQYKSISPGVDTTVICSRGIPTIDKIILDPILTYEFKDGDGVITLESMMTIPKLWKDAKIYTLDGEHTKVLHKKELHDFLI